MKNMIKSVLIAKSGFKYLKIKFLENKTIIIFESQEYIFDYIYHNLNVYHDNYDIHVLAEYCTVENFIIFKKAFEIKEQLYNWWASFYIESEYGGYYQDGGQYDPQFYSMGDFVEGDEK